MFPHFLNQSLITYFNVFSIIFNVYPINYNTIFSYSIFGR